MRIATAIALIDNVVYKPGYGFTAHDHTRRFEGTVKVRLSYAAPETGRANAADGYPETIKTYAEFTIAVGDLEGTDAALGLYRRLLDAVLEVEAHEAREAFRVRPSLWAPFHPHQLDGIEAWRTTEAMCQPEELTRDFQFGIA